VDVALKLGRGGTFDYVGQNGERPLDSAVELGGGKRS